ncbi:MAG: molybdopterin-dependent oxidoreductase, partial [Gemmatimonadales bacterium]
MTDGLDRRRFLKVLGVTGGGAAAMSACGIGPEPQEKLISYLVPPEDQIPGVATYYATTCRECPAGCGLHARVREGRVVKLEGNPDSPINNGRLCASGQAALQGLYNPDRIRTPLGRNADGRLEPIAWDDALARLATRVRGAQGTGGGIVFVTGHEVSTFGDLVNDWMRAVGGRRVAYEPFGYEALREGNRLAFGSAAVPLYDFAAATYVISFGADFLDTWLSPVSFQQGFAAARAPAGRGAPAKLVFVGPRLSTTGMNADEWIAATPGSEGTLALAMAQVIVSRRLGSVPADAARLGDLLARYAPARVADRVGIEASVIERLAAEFAGSGAGLAVAGGMAAHYPNGAAIVAAVNLLGYVAGTVGKTVRFGVDLAQDGAFRDVAALQSDMATGRVAVLMVHGANPGHSLSGGFWQAWGKVGFKISFSCYLDETAAAADLVLPDLHPLEQWSDSRPRAGVYALQQPVMQPVAAPDARQAGDVVLGLMERSGTFKDHLRVRWQELHARYGRGRSFEQFWTDALQRGGLYERAPERAVRLGPDAARFLA